MKLSKAQQQVVDKMREGYILHYDYYKKAHLENDGHRILVMESDFFDMSKAGFLVRCDGGWSTYHHIYCLAEQYKNNKQ